MSNDIKLGQLIHPTLSPQRDAIHVAIIPAICEETLNPGDRVKIKNKEKGIVSRNGVGAYVGIVDPFLDKPVRKGDKFYVCLFQNTVTGMTHHWSHPAFVGFGGKDNQIEDSAKISSIKYLEGFAREVELTYSELMLVAENYLRTGNMYCLGFDTPEIVWSESETFWHHYEIVTGTHVEDNDRNSFFRCAC